MSTTPNNSEALRGFATEVVRRLRDHGHEALFAGGCVRDLLLQRPPKDYDVATSARPEQVQSIFRLTLAIGASFGVVQVRGRDGLAVEVATFRADGDYVDGRRPRSVRFTDAREDALRRDFTVNGMFFDPIDERIHDFVGGRDDLTARIIRAIGDPLRRFDEDKLRLLRAVRFAATLNFSIDPETFEAIRTRAGELSVVSGERILNELRALLEVATRDRGMELLAAVGLAPVVFSELGDAAFDQARVGEAAGLLRRLPDAAALPVSVAVIFDALADSDPAAAAEAFFLRLRGANAERDLCTWLLQHRTDLEAATSRPASYRKRLYADPRWSSLCDVSRARGFGEQVIWCERERKSLPPDVLNPALLVTGDDLKRAGFAPGPAFKVWLERLRDLQLDGEIETPEEALSRVKEWSAQATP